MRMNQSCFWFILFVLFTLNETANSNLGRFWAVCSSDEQCQNGGLCLHNSCDCPYGYTGSNCEVKLQCNDFNCVNNGTCELDLQANKTFCSCNQQPVSGGRFEGVFCEKKVPCNAVGSCLKGGLCHRDPYVTDKFFCKCPDSFIGPVCEERTSCRKHFSLYNCRPGGVCDSNECLCASGYTGYFCELQVTPALNSSTDYYWAFNRQSTTFKGAAKVVRNHQIGNVLSILQAGGGWVDLGQLNNSCIKDFNNCQQGISISFWLQFIDGLYIVAITNVNKTILSMQVKDYRNLLIQLTAGSSRWQIKRSCFPVGWFFLTITWDHTNMLYYENDQLLSKSPPPTQVNYSSHGDSSLLSVGGLNGKGGFSTMRMSDLALWTRVLSRKEVKDSYLKKFSSPITSRCLSNPCLSDQWCEDGLSNFTCIEPAGFYCSFDSGYCQWQNASSNNQHWMRFSEYGSLRHDHTNNSCAGSGKFLGMISQGAVLGSKLSSDIISRPLPRPSVPGRKVSLSMWYYVEGWTRNKLHIVIQSSKGNKTVFIHLHSQSRRWRHLKVEVAVNTNFQVLLRGELNGNGGIFLDDMSIETFSSPVIIQGKTNYSSSLHNSVSMNCSVYNSFNIAWYHDNHRIHQGKTYTILERVESNKNVSVLIVSNLNCQMAGNYTCVAANEYGSVQRQFTLRILDVPRQPSNVMINPKTKQITWQEVAGYECLSESHFVVEYKKNQSVNWTTAGYFDNRRFDLNASKGEIYNVRIYTENVIGRSPPSKVVTFRTNIAPSEIQIFVDKVEVQGSKILLQRGARVNLRCETKAEPRPSFSWMVPGSYNIAMYGPSWVSGIKWQHTLVIRGLTCLNSGDYKCLPKNAMASERASSSIAIRVTEPDPPKTFGVFFVNITSVLITWTAIWCNHAFPSVMTVRYRQEGATAWIERLFKITPAKDFVLTEQFKYNTVYEFRSRLKYEGRFGVYSPVIKMSTPDLANVTVTTRFSGQAGTTMTIYCTAIGLTTSTFTWTKDHMTLQPSHRVKYAVNNTFSVLTIRMTKKADSGNYTCRVSHSKTSLQKTVSVRVSEPPRVHIRPYVRTLFEGDSITFQCYLSRGNISKLYVTWYEMEGSNSQEKLISSHNDSFALTIQGTLTDSMESHVVLYRCCVRNADGVGSSPSVRLIILRKGHKAVCTREVSYGVTWMPTLAGMSDIQQCPNATGTVQRPCLEVGSEVARWGEANFSNCISKKVQEIYNEILAVTEGYAVSRTLSGILEDLESVTAAYRTPRPGDNSRSLYEKDLTASVDALRGLINYNSASRTKPLSNNHDITNSVKTSSNLLGLANLPAWKTALKAEDDLAYKMVSALDEYGHHSMNKTSDIHIQADNVVLIAVKVSANSSTASEGLRMIHGQSSLDLPSTFFSQTNNSVTIVSVIFWTLGNVLTHTEAIKELNTSNSNGSDWFLNSRLASITVRPRPPDVIKPPFKLALETNKVTMARSKRMCVFLNLSGDHNKAWSTEGCSVVSSRTNSTTTTCACDHMTLFAVLMEASSDTETDATDRAALSWISLIGCTLSLIGILITLLVMSCFWKKLRSTRTRVLVNLCVAIGMTDVLIVAMEIADVQNQTGCTVLAVLLHFFILSIFCWMLSEAVQLYFSIVKVIGEAAHSHMRVFYCLGWGLPTLVVVVSLAATGGKGYADPQSCWLSTRNHILWAFVVPALLIVSGNIVILALVIYSMLSSHRLRKEPLIRRFQRGLKASFVLLPLLGISWSFGVLTMTSDKIAFNYIFAIFNSLQGFFIFIFHCVFNKQIRDVLNESKRKRKGFVTDAMTAQSNRKLSTITNTTQGTTSRLSTATSLKIHLQTFRSEITPSPPHPSPAISRTYAFEETSPQPTSPANPRAGSNILLQGNTKEKREEKQEITDHVKDEIIKEKSCRSITPSLNMCDMDERDWTSLESSSESIVECSGDEETTVSLNTTQRQLYKGQIPEQKF